VEKKNHSGSAPPPANQRTAAAASSSSASYERLQSVVEKHLSPIMARGALERALRAIERTPETCSVPDIPALLSRLEMPLRLLMGEAEFKRAWPQLQALAPHETPTVIVVPVRYEVDIGEARLMARRLCEGIGVRALATQQVVVVVSELARNIFQYGGEGRIEIDCPQQTPPVIRITASDRGPGIKNLDEILSGRYRSKTGLGKGLMGVRRLSHDFDVTTGPTGTIVVATVMLERGAHP
jgi:serine/threonine-protein kinase RsbT